MSTNFPTSLDSFTNPTPTQQVSAATVHSSQHANANDSIAALEAKVGVNSSAVTTSHDYKLSAVTGSAKALTNNQPTITDFTNSTHTHQAASSGGLLTEAALSLSGSNTTNDVSSSKHGFAPQGDGSTSKFLNANGAYSTPSVTGVTVTTVRPLVPGWMPTGGGNPLVSGPSLNVNTTAYVGLVTFPHNITANAITLDVQGFTTSGTMKVALYSEDGATRLFNVTSSTISGTGVLTIALSSVSITAGNYYLLVVSVSTLDIVMYGWNTNGTGASVFGNVTTKKVWEGTLTVSAGTPPSTITPTSITWAANSTVVSRFDN